MKNLALGDYYFISHICSLKPRYTLEVGLASLRNMRKIGLKIINTMCLSVLILIDSNAQRYWSLLSQPLVSWKALEVLDSDPWMIWTVNTLICVYFLPHCKSQILQTLYNLKLTHGILFPGICGSSD